MRAKGIPNLFFFVVVVVVHEQMSDFFLVMLVFSRPLSPNISLKVSCFELCDFAVIIINTETTFWTLKLG